MHPTHLLPTNGAELTPDTTTPALTLRAAALYLDRHGWCQGSYYEQTATVFTPAACTVGAIGMACYGGPVDAPALNFDDPGWADFDKAVAYLDLYLLHRHDSDVYSFNDTKGRTAEQVTAALRSAADEWEHTGVCSPARQRCACRCGCDDDAARYCHGQGEQPGRRCLYCLTHHPIAADAARTSGGGT
jgi:hypothetical protein